MIARFWVGTNRWWLALLIALWPSFGGHFIEVWFLNWLRPRLSASRNVQIAARLVTWFVAGTALALGMRFTAGVRAPWWLEGFAFIAIELIAHLPFQLLGRASFYNGRG